MDFKDWLTEMERIAAPKVKKVASPTGIRKPTTKAVMPAHLGKADSFTKFKGVNVYGTPEFFKQPPKTIQRPSD